MDGIELITKECGRQVSEEACDQDHDDEHGEGEFAIAAACYAVVDATGQDMNDKICVVNAAGEDAWPWDNMDKRNKHDSLRRLAITGALIAAEIDWRLAKRLGAG